MKINEVIKAFLEYQEAKGNSEKTLVYYSINLNRFSEYAGNIAIENITIELLRNYVKHLQGTIKHENNEFYPEDKKGKISSISVQTYVRAVRAFLGWMHREGFINTNFLALLPLPKARQKVIEVLSDDDIIRLNKTFNLNTKNGCRNACIFALMLDSGLRLGEVLSLRIEDINFINNIVKVQGKGDKERLVPFGRETRKRLYKYIYTYHKGASDENVFMSGTKPMTENAVKIMFGRLAKKTGVEVHPHLLRHTFATRFIMAGGNIFTLQSILGHTTLEMVKRYSHLSDAYNWARVRERSVMDRLV